MGPLDYFLRVLVNIIMAMVLGSLMIGLFGLLVAGQEGLVNGMVWGAAFGILGGLAVTSTFDSLAFWNGFFSRFTKSKFEDTPDDRK